MMSFVLVLGSLDVLPMAQTCLVLNDILDPLKALCFDNLDTLSEHLSQLRKL